MAHKWLVENENLTGRFVERYESGEVQRGVFYISRPGRIRLEYDIPKDVVIVCDGRTLAVFDPKNNEGPTFSDYESSPFQPLLSGPLGIAGNDAISGASRRDRETYIFARPSGAYRGKVALVFNNQPVFLKGWILTGSGSGRVSVEINSTTRMDKIPNSLFRISSPYQKR
ncbi:outer membrane lipoprotein carrier protein LolA [Rhodovulum sulfidophilum]|uniref:LolA family protein n=1 Tax=Rhodovulum sulfidophilum TaxID=35806 RepID=UPI0019242921|nr:outer membrane lipoprotein carrier protein LolA [Rhodovulum sulfidophilum]MBL3566704.1 outer membrane lipoprotein carrier protein LolA [Rhodovulum sulfidophilum]